MIFKPKKKNAFLANLPASIAFKPLLDALNAILIVLILTYMITLVIIYAKLVFGEMARIVSHVKIHVKLAQVILSATLAIDLPQGLIPDYKDFYMNLNA